MALGLLGVVAVWLGATALVTYRNLDRGLPPDSSLPPILEPSSRINVLALGLDAQLDAHGKPIIDWRRAHGRADTVMLVSFDLKAHRVAILSLPRDSRVRIPGRGTDKLNAAHVYGGPALAIRTVQDLTGVPIHYYVRTSFAGVAKVVDLLGGVEFDVPQNMDYEDPVQGLYIHLKAGRQLLDGDKAVQLLRFRHYPDGDITRIHVQQQFLQALMDKALSVVTLARLPFLVDDVLACVDTNIPSGKAVSLARLGLGLNASSLQAGTAPGSPRDIGGVSYWILDERGLATSVRQVLYGIGEPVRVEVLNGTAYGGMAAKAADILRKQGFSVVQVGNAEKQAQHTLIQGHGTSASIPDAVAGALAGIVRQPRLQILGAQEGSVSAAPDKGEVDVTVILGADAVPPQDQRTD